MSTLSAVTSRRILKEIQLEPVSRMDLIKYAGASGDFNPIHTIDDGGQKRQDYQGLLLMECGRWEILQSYLRLILKKASFRITRSALKEWYF